VSDYPVLPFAGAGAWAAWLEQHHADTPGVWLRIARKATGIPTVTHAEALDVALCFGWIDGQRNRFDEQWFLQKFTPRRARSRWSRINCGKVDALTAEGRMRPAGLREVERAKADGRWDAAYASPRNAGVPPDFEDALAANPPAAATFATLTSANRYAFLYRIDEARRPETRARRIAQFVEMLAEGRTLH